MDVVDVSRWQFGITTVYHFIFVPLTIGLAPMVAGDADTLGRHRKPALVSDDPVLWEDLP